MENNCQACHRAFATAPTLNKHYPSKMHKDKFDEQQNQEMMDKLDDYIKSVPNTQQGSITQTFK